MHDAAMFNDGHLVFNGIHGRTGAYLTPPLSAAQIAHVARGHRLESAELDDLSAVLSQAHLHHRGPAAGIDPDDLAQTGWGVIFPLVTADSEASRQQAAIRDALAPLLALRRAQASVRCERYYRELVGRNDAYRPNETKQQFLARLGVGPGPADPERLPYYLLLVGSPEEIPYHVEYQLDVQYAVGRIHFDTLEEYAYYARSVVEVETGGATSPRRAVFFGAANPNDPATALSRRFLLEPLATLAEREATANGWSVLPLIGEQASKARLTALLRDEAPAFLFTATHGIAFDATDPRLRAYQGALLCQDWGGPGTPPTPDMYFAGEDIAEHADLRGLIAFHFACFSAGTPRYDEFSRRAFDRLNPLAPNPFVARLPQRLLGHAGGGALAAVGHVDRAWGSSFVQPDPAEEHAWNPRTSAFESGVKSILRGHRVGHAMEYFNVRYAEMASELTERLQAIEIYNEHCSAELLAMMWLEANDARNYTVVGDPAVRLAMVCTEHEPGTGTQQDQQRPPPSIVSVKDALARGSEGQPRNEAPRRPEVVEPTESIDRLMSEVSEYVCLILEHSRTIEVRTAVDVAGASATASAEDEKVHPARPSPVAFTRIGPGGDTEVHLPVGDGRLDERLWSLHQAMVAQARADRRELWRLLRALLIRGMQ